MATGGESVGGAGPAGVATGGESAGDSGLGAADVGVKSLVTVN